MRFGETNTAWRPIFGWECCSEMQAVNDDNELNFSETEIFLSNGLAAP